MCAELNERKADLAVGAGGRVRVRLALVVGRHVD